MIPRVRRCVRCFEKLGDEFIKEILLVGITLDQLQRIFELPPDDPMYECFRIDEEHAKELAPYLAEPLDLDSYECFVECDALPGD